ncbi:MAG: HU family DNA-binding protein [bacterium]
MHPEYHLKVDFLKILLENLPAKKIINFNNLGIIYVTERPGLSAPNPQTGAMIHIPALTGCGFLPFDATDSNINLGKIFTRKEFDKFISETNYPVFNFIDQELAELVTKYQAFQKTEVISLFNCDGIRLGMITLKFYPGNTKINLSGFGTDELLIPNDRQYLSLHLTREVFASINPLLPFLKIIKEPDLKLGTYMDDDCEVPAANDVLGLEIIK